MNRPNHPWLSVMRCLALSAAGVWLTCSAQTAVPATNQFPMRCTVILQTRPDRLYCFVTNTPVRVNLRQAAEFANGEVIEVTSVGGSVVVTNVIQPILTLLGAKVRRLGQTNLPPPLRLKPSELTNGVLNYRRVAVVGRVTSHEMMYFADRYIEILVAEGTDGIPFRVEVLDNSKARERMPIGTEAEFVGLSYTEVLVDEVGPTAQVDVKNFDECTILRSAPWLTFERARLLVFVGAALALVGGVWFVRERYQIGRLRAAERAVRQLNAELESRVAQRTAALRQSEAQFRALYEISSAVLAVEDLNSLYVRIHDAVRSVMRAENFFLLLHNPTTDLHEYVYHVDQMDPWPKPRKVSAGLVGYILRTGRSLRVGRASMTDPRNEWCSVSGTPSAVWLGVPLRVRGQTIGVMAVQNYHEATAYGEAEEKILTYVATQTAQAIEGKRAAEDLARFAAIAGVTSDFMGFADMEQRVRFINAAGRRMLGLSADEPLDGMMVKDIYPAWAYQKISDVILPASLRDGAWSGEIVVLRRDGTEVPVSMVGVIPRNHAGQPAFMSAVMRDISERKQIETDMQRALAQEKELSELKSRFVSMVSHEFRTPLGIIMGSAEILEAYLDRLPPAERHANLKDILQSAGHMARLMEEVLLLGRVEAGKLGCRRGPLDLAAFCARMVEEADSAAAGRCLVRLQTPPNLQPAQADESLLRHIFSNLLSNAVKYSPAGTPVDFVIEPRGSDVVFTVRDQGLGIPAEDQRQLFQAFHRGRNVGETQGTGLGMVIVKHCVELHCGQISFESCEGHGTTFTVELPLFNPVVPPTSSSGNTPAVIHSNFPDSSVAPARGDEQTTP